MKVKGYIEITSPAMGLETTSLRQSLAVDVIDAVMDIGAVTASDREKMNIQPHTKSLLICKSLSDTPCEVEETYEQILALIKEATDHA